MLTATRRTKGESNMPMSIMNTPFYRLGG
jgi:hypothetical protein